MRTFLDGEPLGSAGLSLSSALEAARRRCAAGHRLVVSAVADGRTVPFEDFDRPPAREPYAQELHFVTADPLGLVRQSLTDAAEALAALEPVHREAAEAVQTGRTDRVVGPLQDILSGWQNVSQVLHLVDRVPGVAVGSPVEDAPRALADLAERLHELRRSLVSEDWSSLADVLAYDLPSLAERWRGVLGEVSRGLVRAPAAGAS
ncbi:MAG: hypothetical protein IBJ11_09065 [Phycisphaerales bacterium]|nr:hypothetical protein [Phycisphaerales bacterium]